MTEEIWNTTASLEYQPYSYSKTLAEKKAWEIAKRFEISKMKVSSVCEQLKIKIKPCQLGAF